MDDESADRVYVPGSSNTPAPPARDVEPFWAPEELAAPVHGGRPVPVDAAPPVPVTQPSGVYQPADRPIPVPPPAHLPVPPQVPVPRPSVVAAPTQAWPDLGQRPAIGHQPVSAAPHSAVPSSGLPSSAVPDESGVHTSPDSPWSQPPQRPVPSTPAPRAAVRVPPLPEVAPLPQIRPVQQVPPPHAQPAQTQPPQTQPPAVPTQRQPAMPGPYPPAIDSRVARAHPQQAAPPQPMPPHLGGPQPTPPHPAPPQHPGQQHPGQQYPGQQYPAQHHPGQPPQASLPVPAADPFQDLQWVSDGTPTAEEFARRRLAKPAEPTATMGPRALLKKGTMGLVKLAPGKRELEFKQDVEMVRRNFGGLRQVTVVNPKGGAGKTVAVLLLAMTFGQKRGGYVLAWDNNETQGTLGMRAQQDFHARTVRDMMRDLHLFRGAQGRVGDLSQYVRAQGEGMFDVLASDESATAGEMLTASAFGEIREIVSRFYKLIFVDTGNNVRAQNWQAAIDATDQLVVTMSARNDSAETAARMLDHLEQSGRQRLVRQAVSVVTMPPTRKDIDLPAIQRHFAARTRAVLLAPYEKLIDSGEPLRYGQLSGSTKDAWLKIAAAVAEGL